VSEFAGKNPWTDCGETSLYHCYLARTQFKIYHALIISGQSSSVSIVTRLRAGQPGFDSRQGRGFFSSPPRPAFYPMRTERSFPGVKRPGREADHLSPSSTEVKSVTSWRGA
jgi:hypothetical protein